MIQDRLELIQLKEVHRIRRGAMEYEDVGCGAEVAPERSAFLRPGDVEGRATGFR